MIAHMDAMITPSPMSAPMNSGTNAPNAPAELPSMTIVSSKTMSIFISFFSSYRLVSSLVFSS
jgi:hypothetical protein